MGRKPLITPKIAQEILSDAPYKMVDKHFLSQKYDFSLKTIERFIKKNDLIHTSSQNIECIMRYINGENVSELTTIYNMSQANLNALMRYRNIPQRGTHYFANFDYFNEIDSQEKAYFLGFIYADGNLFKNSISISIRDYDRDVLDKMKSCMDSNHKILVTPITDFYDSSKKLDGNMVQLIITHKNIRQAMLKHGVVENKTFHINELPKTVPRELMVHFIRGYIDGDGSFTKYKPSDNYYRYCFSVTGNIGFLEELRDFVVSCVDVKFNKTLQDRYPDRINETRTLKLSGKENLAKLLNWLYNDSSIYMNRKYIKYKDIIS